MRRIAIVAAITGIADGISRQRTKTSTDRIVIFHDDSEQVWRWPVRRAVGNTTTTRLSRHKHRNGDPDPRFAAKLDVGDLTAGACGG